MKTEKKQRFTKEQKRLDKALDLLIEARNKLEKISAVEIDVREEWAKHLDEGSDKINDVISDLITHKPEGIDMYKE